MNDLKFTNLDVKPEILKAVAYMGFEEMTPIQVRAIPTALEGRDLVGQAQTGTGKTVISAFDFKRFKEKNKKAKLLFVAHRKEILQQSILL